MYIYIHIYIYILTVDFCLLPQEHYTFMWKNVHTHTHLYVTLIAAGVASLLLVVGLTVTSMPLNSSLSSSFTPLLLSLAQLLFLDPSGQ